MRRLPMLSRVALLAGLTVVALALVVVAGSYRGEADEEPSATTTETTTETTDEPPRTTSDALRLTVYERALSECATHPTRELARIYGVDAGDRAAVVTAVARAWVNRLGAGRDAIRSGRDGCVEGFRQSAS